jgi:prevent-host-death family protein
VRQVPLRDLRNFTSRVLARVKSGEVLEITDRGRPVARIVPIELDQWGQLEALGLVEPRAEEGDLLDIEPVDPIPGVPLPSEILAQLRAGER